MAVVAEDDAPPPMPTDATAVTPSIAEQRRAHAAEQPAAITTPDDNPPTQPSAPPSILSVPWAQAGKQLWDEGSRDIGLGTRATLEGLGGAVGAVGDVLTWPGRAIGKAIGYEPPKELPWMKDLVTAPSDQISQGIDALNLPTPKTPTEQNVSTAVSGAAAAVPSLLSGGAPTVVNAVRLLLQGGIGAILGKKASESDLVPDWLKPAVNLGVGFLGGKAADVGTTLGAKAVNAVAGNMSPVYDAFVRSGVPPRLLGTVAGGEAGSSAEAAASRIPFASSIMRPAQQQTVDEFGNSVERTARQLDPAGASATAQTTGQNLQNEYRAWLGPGGDFQTGQAARWNPLNQRMAGAAVDPGPYRAALDNAANPPNLASMPATQQAFSSPQARAWLDALNRDAPPGANLSWEQAQAVKQRIGDAMGTPDLVGSIGMQNLKNIYAGLARGMENTAVQHGQGQLFSDANQFTTEGHNFIDTVGSKIAKANNPAQETIDPEQATKSILNSGDTTLQAVRDRLPVAADTLAAYKLQQAQTAKPSTATSYDDTSTGTFLSNMNALRQSRPGGYNALYNTPQIQQQLDDLQTVAGRLRATERHLNTSGTAEQLGWMKYVENILASKSASEAAYNIAAPPVFGLGGASALTSPALTRYAAARGAGPPIVPPGSAGLLGSTANLTGQ